jgi:hypothetical protein
MAIAPLKAKAQTNDPPPSGSCYVFSPSSSSVVEYSRRGMIVWEITPTSATDYDFTPWGLEENSVVIVGWTDFMEGEDRGEFGYSPDGYSFYPVNNPEWVNAYRPKPGFVGVLRIAPILDDIPIGIYSGMPTYDDDPVTGEPWEMTIWEFWITPCPSGWRPRLDDTLQFSAYIRPTIDHTGQSMASIIKFFLTSSLEPGYCLNATREIGEWNDTIGADLKFPDQPGFEITGLDRNIATTTYLTTEATVHVVCLDYGAYGVIEAMAYIAAGKNETARLEGTLDVYMAKIPVDNDNNHIADSWAFNYLGSPTRDDDPEPPARIQGDGFSLYEEYRGFIVKGNRRELNPLRKDVFIVNLLDELYHPGLGLDLGYFPNLGITVHLIWNTEHRGYVNFLHRTAHILDQGCIVLTEGFFSEENMGETDIDLPVPTTCVIYTETIRAMGPPHFDRYTWDKLDVEATKSIIAHELGHAIHLQHHGTGTTTNCVMFVPQTVAEELAWWLQIPADYCDNNPGCRFLWLLRPP